MAAVGFIRTRCPRSRFAVAGRWMLQTWSSSHGAPQSAQTWRRGRCLMVRGPSNSQLGANGSANITARAARPIQGVSTCGILAFFLFWYACEIRVVGRRLAGWRAVRATTPPTAVQALDQPEDEVGLKEQEDDGERNRCQFGEEQQQVAEDDLECVHRDVPSLRAWRLSKVGRGVAGRRYLKPVVPSNHPLESVILQVPV